MHVLLVEAEQAQEIDEVGLHEAQRAEIGELVVAEAEGAEQAHLGADLVDVRAEVDAFGAALELVLDLRPGEMMQHHLHHRELVKVGVERRLDDHAASL
ncbi:hypothetical protein D3C83_20660 [compost metagenome]